MSEFENMMSRSRGYRVKSVKDVGWNILEELYQSNFINGTDRTPRIPKIIHQIWLGSEVPKKYDEWRESWKKFHPDWEYRLWTDEDVEKLDFPLKDLYYSLSNYGPKSDVLRYHLLYEFGGLYADTDFECLRSFEPLRRFEFVSCVGFSSFVEIYVGLILSVPRHPIIKHVLESMSNIEPYQVMHDTLSGTSTKFFTKNFFEVVREYKPGVVILPFEYFYPVPNKPEAIVGKNEDYVRKNSYAIHHWEVSWAVRGEGGVDWIQGEKFPSLAHFTYSPYNKHADDYDGLPNTFDPANLLPGINIIYTHTFYVKTLFNIIKHLPGKFVVITHNGDENIDKSYEIPDNVVKWFSQNVDVYHPKLEPLPIGIQNLRWMSKVNKLHIIRRLLEQPKGNDGLAYLCCRIKTNVNKRKPLYDMFRDKPWVKVEGGEKDVKPSQYLSSIRNHVFVFCPEGNGVDTHRFWETLYLGSYPIVIRTQHTSFWEKDFPVCYVNEWEDVTEDFLLQEKERLDKMVWDRSKLNFGYWKSKILRYLENGGLL